VTDHVRCGKVAFATWEEATRGMRSVMGSSRYDGKRLRVYRCDCGLWHFGHSRRAGRMKSRLERMGWAV